MRYFKYNGPWNDTQSQRKIYMDLSALMQKKQHKACVIRKVGTAVFILVALTAFVIFKILLHQLTAEADHVITAIINFLLKLALSFCALLISTILGALTAVPFWGRYEKAEKKLMRECLQNACGTLKNFYQFQEPFIVTKCYRSSDRKFDRHDICIFIAEDRIRITANLHYGFFHPSRDLGCYELDRQDISFQNAVFKERPAIELQAGDVSFLLSRKAKTFIERFKNSEYIEKRSLK